MDEDFFIVLNLILLGIAGVAVIVYFVFLTRKRLGSGYTHPRKEPPTPPPTKSPKETDVH